MDVRSKKYNAKAAEIVTFPGVDAELSAQTIKDLNLGPALGRLGNALIRQTKDSNYYDGKARNATDTGYGREVPTQCVGVKITKITIQFIFQEKPNAN